MSKKLSIFLSILMIMTLIFAGCSANEQAPETSGDTETKKDSQKPVTIKLAYVMQETYSAHIALRDVFKPYVEEKSGGKLKIELYPNGQLGGERQAIEAVQLNTIQMTIPTSSTLSGFEEKFQVFDLPYLFKSKEVAYKALDGELGDKVNDLLPAIGLKCLAYEENGYRHVTNNRGPIEKPEDLKGMKIRTMENPMHMGLFKQFGANPTPISFNELYTALQQGTVDAQENPVALVYTSKFYEVQDYYSLTGHVYTPGIVLINNDFFNGLSDDLQKILLDGAAKFRDEQRKLSAEQDAESLELLKDNGMQINELTPEQKQAFVDAALPVYDEFKDVLGEELLQLAKDANNLVD